VPDGSEVSRSDSSDGSVVNLEERVDQLCRQVSILGSQTDTFGGQVAQQESRILRLRAVVLSVEEAIEEEGSAIDRQVAALDQRVAALDDMCRSLFHALGVRLEDVATRVEGLTTRFDDLISQINAIQEEQNRFRTFGEETETDFDQLNGVLEKIDVAVRNSHATEADLYRQVEELRQQIDALNAQLRQQTGLPGPVLEQSTSNYDC
jgi:chromosome segregation ATPase